MTDNDADHSEKLLTFAQVIGANDVLRITETGVTAIVSHGGGAGSLTAVQGMCTKQIKSIVLISQTQGHI